MTGHTLYQDGESSVVLRMTHREAGRLDGALAAAIARGIDPDGVFAEVRAIIAAVGTPPAVIPCARRGWVK